MKKLLLFLTLLLLTNISFSQNIEKIVDSLTKVLNPLRDDTAKVNPYTKVLDVAKDDTFKVNAYNILSKRLWLSGYYAKAMYNANQALALGNKLNFKKGIATAYNNMGIVNVQQANYQEALKNYRIALSMRLEIGDKNAIGYSYNNIGNAYLQLSNYAEALKNYFTMLKIAEESNDMGLIAIAHVSLGNVYLQQGNYTEALKNHFEALKSMQNGHDDHGVVMSYDNIGDIYVKQGNYDEALKIFLKALELQKSQSGYEAFEDKLSKANLYGSIANVYLQLGNYTESLKNYLVALDFQQQMNYKYGIADSYIGMGKIYFKQHKEAEAKDYLQKGLVLAKENGAKDEIKDAYEELSRLDSSTGNINGAYTYYRLYSQIKDSIVNEESNKQISQLKIQYQSEKNEKEITLLNSENKIKQEEVEKQIIVKYVAVSISILTILIAILFFYNNRIKEKTRQLTKANEIRQRISRDLHDEIGAGLTSIAMKCEQARTKDVYNHVPERTVFDKISAQSHSLNEKLSEVVWATNPENDNLASLVSYIRNYVLRYFEDSAISYKLKLQDEIPDLSLKPDVSRNLFFVLKEALNNCSKHSQASLVEVFFHIDADQRYVLNIDDNGKGIDNNIIAAHRNGLRNMQKRIEEINGKFEIKSEIGKGTHINIAGNLS